LRIHLLFILVIKVLELCAGPQQHQTNGTLMDDATAAVKHAMHAMCEGLATTGTDSIDACTASSAVQHCSKQGAIDTGTVVDALEVATREVKAVAEAGVLWRRDYQTLIKRAQQLVARREQLSWMQASVAAWYATFAWLITNNNGTDVLVRRKQAPVTV
jgi:hypothetical protein